MGYVEDSEGERSVVPTNVEGDVYYFICEVRSSAVGISNFDRRGWTSVELQFVNQLSRYDVAAGARVQEDGDGGLLEKSPDYHGLRGGGPWVAVFILKVGIRRRRRFNKVWVLLGVGTC